MVYQDPAILQELQQEAESWKRTLEFIRDENIQLKTRLSEIIRQNHADQQFLDTAEYYNARFLSEDEMLRLLRRDISELDRILVKHIVENDEEMSGICVKHEKLRHEIEIAEREFKNLKYNFYDYLSLVLN